MFLQTQAQTALMAPGSDVTALRGLFAELLTDSSTVQRIGDLLAGADVRYDMGAADPAGPTGWFAPSASLELADGTTRRLPELPRTARPVLIDPTGEFRAASEAWNDRVDYVRVADDSTIPSMLVRPDGFVAWSDHDPVEPDTALRTWFGTSTAAPLQSRA